MGIICENSDIKKAISDEKISSEKGLLVNTMVHIILKIR